MDLIRNFKIHAAALIIVVLAELVGVQKFGLVVLLPLLYALVFGALVSFPRWSVVRLDEMNRAGKMLSVGVLLLITKIALDIGPNIEMIMQSGWALIMQEFGHFFGTLIFGLPVALLVGMKREAIGACYSIDREPNVAIISERFGLDSPEGHGVMGMYVCGTVFGALWVSVLAGVIAQMGFFHPHALAMGAGIGSDGRSDELDHRRASGMGRNRACLCSGGQSSHVCDRHLLCALCFAPRYDQGL